jgi:hypothetical protein
MQQRTTTVTAVGSAIVSTPLRLDSWAQAPIGIQVVVVSGSPTYSVQHSFDDPNDPVNPIAYGSMTWSNCPTASLVGATTTQTGSYAFVPTFIQLSVAATTGVARLTILQPSAVPY